MDALPQRLSGGAAQRDEQQADHQEQDEPVGEALHAGQLERWPRGVLHELGVVARVHHQAVHPLGVPQTGTSQHHGAEATGSGMGGGGFGT